MIRTFGPAPRHRAHGTMLRMDVDRNGLEVLDRAHCLELLHARSVGRIALTIDALPTVLPVNFKVVDDEIVLRTGPGGKLEAATNQAVVAFEVDDFDPMEHTGWSVVITGIARHVTDPAHLDRLGVHTIPRWAAGPDGDNVVAISTDLISGRRISHRAVAVP